MNTRTEYFEHVLDDALHAAGMTLEALEGMTQAERAPIVAALIQSDSLNGLRKAMLELAEATRRRT